MSRTCKIINQTGQAIKYLSVQKFFGDNPDGNLSESQVADGASVYLNFTGGSGSGDYWTFSFIGADDGLTYHKTQKRCDVESEDLYSTTDVQLVFMQSGSGFSIIMPMSSSCNDNSYDIN